MDLSKRWVAGGPKRYVFGHQTRKHHLSSYIVADRGYETPCWVWQGNATDSGYARFKSGGRPVYVHRASYEKRYGPISPDTLIHHRCLTRLCINPEHLKQVTHAEHLKAHRPSWNVRRFERLSQKEIDLIRSTYATGSHSQSQLAEQFGISQNTISRIVRHDGGFS